MYHFPYAIIIPFDNTMCENTHHTPSIIHLANLHILRFFFPPYFRLLLHRFLQPPLPSISQRNRKQKMERDSKFPSLPSSSAFSPVIPLTHHAEKTKLRSQGDLSTPLTEGGELAASWHRRGLGSPGGRPVLAHLPPLARGRSGAPRTPMSGKLIPALWR